MYKRQPDGNVATYQIYSVGVVKDTSEGYTYQFADDAAFASFLEATKASSLYDTGVEVGNDSQIVTLSTCTREGNDDRTIVHGVRVNVQPAGEDVYKRQAIVTLKKGEGRLLKSGGAWIFDNEIDSIMGEFENGDIVIVHDFDGYGMGRGFINMNSKIRIRMMTRKQDQEIDHAFLEMRVRDAWEYRKKTVRCV